MYFEIYNKKDGFDKPVAVINAAAWTDVDGAETAEDEASVVNGEAPGAMARACAKLSIPFLHLLFHSLFNRKTI